MKKLLVLMFVSLSLHSFAQSDEEKPLVKKGFKKEKLFTGGSATVGFSSYSTTLGIDPQLGYSLTNWADVGINLNLNYTAQRDYQTYGDKLRQLFTGRALLQDYFP